MVECPLLTYNRDVTSAKGSRPLSDWIPGWMAVDAKGAKSACLHFFTSKASGLRGGNPFEVLTLATRQEGLLSLRELSIHPLGAHGIKVPERGAVVPETSKRVWIEKLFEGMYSKGQIDTSGLENFLSKAMLRKVLTGHIVALHYAPLLKVRQLNKSLKETNETSSASFTLPGESITKATARIYEELQSWGETRAAAVIAAAEGVTSTTIHNRLQLARASKYLESPGQGARLLPRR